MIDLTMLTSFVVSATPYLFDAFQAVRDRTSDEAPLVKSTDDGLTLNRPDRRLTVGLSAADGEHIVPTIFVEKDGSWAHEKARAVADSFVGEVDVVVRGTAHSAWPRDPVPFAQDNPIRPGSSVGHYRGYAGSVGCIAETAGNSPTRRACTGAAHVLSILNRANPGDDVIRPGVPDGPKSRTNRIGALDTFTYLGHWDRDLAAVLSPNEVDIALVLLDDEAAADDVNLVPDPKGAGPLKRIGGVVPTGECLRYIGEPVFKVGRTSRLTEGVVVGLEDECPITLPDRRTYLYSQLVQVEKTGSRPFSEPGDSGALVYTSDLKGLGLVVGGNDRFSWVAPLMKCLAEVQANLMT